jgi:photosystem II stability/assembly factor-like uncharacterized protein
MVVNGYEKTDFRDIHAFDSNMAIIMGIGNPAYILKTKDGGQTWYVVYTKEMSGMFLDALDFRNRKEGICIGDPVDAGEGRKVFFVVRTMDGGETWIREPSDKWQPALDGEAVFSASGTNIALLDSKDFDYAFISGGLASKLYMVGRHSKPNKVFALHVAQGKETTGAFSMATDGRKKFYCIGGDYKAPEAMNDNSVWTIDGGDSWKTPGTKPPYGYRSCVRIVDGERMVACGTNGVDICYNPNQWKRVSKEGFNVCMVSPNKKLIFLAGEKGKIGVIKY